MTVDVRSSGRFKHFGYPIKGGIKEDDSFTQCESCSTRLWKDTLMDTVHCPSCGLELDTNYSEYGRGSTSSSSKGGVRPSKTTLQRVDPNSPPKYDGSDRVRLFGGIFSAYDGDGEYEFGQMDELLTD